ncbi:hypothetical protein D3C74_448990 [compost metagenome]
MELCSEKVLAVDFHTPEPDNFLEENGSELLGIQILILEHAGKGLVSFWTRLRSTWISNA